MFIHKRIIHIFKRNCKGKRMKQKYILNGLVGLVILSLLGIGYIIARDALRTPEDYWRLAQEEMADKNYARAERYLIKAADGEIPQAQYELALMYDAGDKIPENRELAKKYMGGALKQHLPDAYYVTAVWMERGYYGAPKQEVIVRYYEYAAKHDIINAMKSLIVLYSEGAGRFPDNLERKAYWMKQLEQKGNKK